MAFQFYGSVSEAAEMAGCDSSVLTASMQKAINNWINTKIRKDGFVEHDDAVEYFSIKDNRQNILILANIPIIDGTVLITNNAQSPTDNIELDDECYMVDNDTGIIQLLSDQSFSGVNVISYFTKGIKSVKVEYNYGYATVPTDIIDFATLLIAKWGKVKTIGNANADGLKSEKVADYSKTFDLSFMSATSEFDNMIKDMFNDLLANYNPGI